jgi:hypothetical protein
MQTVILKLADHDQTYTIRGLTLSQSSWVRGFAGTDKMKMVIGVIMQGTIEPRMDRKAATQFCKDHPSEAGLIASEVIKLTVGHV